MSSGTDTERLFVAAPLNEVIREELKGFIASQAPGGRLPGRQVAADNWHFTLKFLGDTVRPDKERLLNELDGADLGKAFSVGFGRLGAFPNPGRARVLWLGAGTGAEALAELALRVEEAAVASGFEPERRKFRAHLTLARFRPEEDVQRLVEGVPAFAGSYTVDEVVLYRSHLGPSGARYESVRRFALG
jgi:2'-5' RNA ligase